MTEDRFVKCPKCGEREIRIAELVQMLQYKRATYIDSIQADGEFVRNTRT